MRCNSTKFKKYTLNNGDTIAVTRSLIQVGLPVHYKPNCCGPQCMYHVVANSSSSPRKY